jgi:hypothetical protein
MSCLPSNERGRCSNHGYYCTDPNPGCICDKNWKGLGFFALVEGLGCDSKDPENSILWSITLILAAISMISILRVLYFRCIKKKTVCIFKYDASSLFPLTALLSQISTFLLALIKIVYQNKQLIGRDIATTILYGVFPLLYIITLVNYFSMVVKFLRGSIEGFPSEIRGKVLKRFDCLSYLILTASPIAIFSCFIPIVGIPLPIYRNIFARASMIGHGATALLYGLFTCNVLKLLLLELSSHINSVDQVDEAIKIIHKRLHFAYRIISSNCLVVGVTCITFGSWDFLIRKSTYLICVLVCGTSFAFIMLMFTISDVSRPKRFVVPLVTLTGQLPNYLRKM